MSELQTDLTMQCNSMLDDFKNTFKDFHWRRKGIFFTEALPFCALCKMMDIDLILESGVRNGDSTEMWLKYLGNDFMIRSIDEFKFAADLKKTTERLSKYPNLEFIKGDGCLKIPELAKLHSDKKIAVLIDGPKNQLAIDTALKAMSLGPQIKFVAIHDLGEGAHRLGNHNAKKATVAVKNEPSLIFNTDCSWYRNQFAEIDPLLGGGDLNKDWVTYRKKYPKGCGMAFLANDEVLSKYPKNTNNF